MCNFKPCSCLPCDSKWAASALHAVQPHTAESTTLNIDQHSTHHSAAWTASTTGLSKDITKFKNGNLRMSGHPLPLTFATKPQG